MIDWNEWFQKSQHTGSSYPSNLAGVNWSMLYWAKELEEENRQKNKVYINNMASNVFQKSALKI